MSFRRVYKRKKSGRWKLCEYCQLIVSHAPNFQPPNVRPSCPIRICCHTHFIEFLVLFIPNLPKFMKKEVNLNTTKLKTRGRHFMHKKTPCFRHLQSFTQILRATPDLAYGGTPENLYKIYIHLHCYLEGVSFGNELIYHHNGATVESKFGINIDETFFESIQTYVLSVNKLHALQYKYECRKQKYKLAKSIMDK